MNRSYSKMRHIQNVNMLMESRRLNEQETEPDYSNVEPPGFSEIKTELGDFGYDFIEELPKTDNTISYKFQHVKTKGPLILTLYNKKGKAAVFGKQYGIKVGNENEIFFNHIKDPEFKNKFFLKTDDYIDRQN